MTGDGADGEIDLATIERRVRLATALGFLPGVSEPSAFQDVAGWVSAHVGLVRLEVGADLGHFAAWVAGESAGMIGRLGEHFSLVDATNDDVQRARALGNALGPRGVAMGLTASPGGLGAGYLLLGNFASSAVREAVGGHAAQLAGLDGLGLTEVWEVGASAGLAKPLLTVTFPIPMDCEVVATVNAVADLWDVEPFDSIVLDLLTEGQRGAALSLDLSEDGLVALSLKVDSVSDESLVRLVEWAGTELDVFARLEGALGAGSRGATSRRDAQGMRVGFTWELG